MKENQMKRGKIKKWLFLIISIYLSMCFFDPFKVLANEEGEKRWAGFDEKVIERIAEERGRKPYSFINLEGDLELFVFSFFSGVAGFVAGYYWRKLMSKAEDVSISS